MRIVYVVLGFAAAVLGSEVAQNRTDRPTPPAPGWKYLYNCNVSMGYYIPLTEGLDLGQGRQNMSRAVLPIQGGQFEGPNGLTGKVLAVGAEWSTYNNDTKYFISDARYQLETMDRANIFVSTQGNTASKGIVHVTAKFETGSANYSWLNDVLAVGILQTTKLGYMIDMWQVMSPKYPD